MKQQQQQQPPHALAVSTGDVDGRHGLEVRIKRVFRIDNHIVLLMRSVAKGFFYYNFLIFATCIYIFSFFYFIEEYWRELTNAVRGGGGVKRRKLMKQTKAQVKRRNFDEEYWSKRY